MSNDNFTGIWIPAEIWNSKDYSLTEKVFIVQINQLSINNGYMSASNAYLADFFDLSKSRVSHILSGLSDKGLIRIEQIKEGKRTVARHIYPLFKIGFAPIAETEHPVADLATPVAEIAIPPCENSEVINKDIKQSIKQTTTKRFCKPTSGELASYMAELGFNTPEETATYFLDYYESKDWMIGKNRMKDWKAAVRTWKRKEKPQAVNQPDIPIQPIIDHYNKILGSTLNHKITLVSPQLTRDIAKRWNESSGPARKVEWWDYIESPQYFPKRYQLEEFVGFQFEKVLNEIWSS
jgi:hypothetical protein